MNSNVWSQTGVHVHSNRAERALYCVQEGRAKRRLARDLDDSRSVRLARTDLKRWHAGG